MKTRSVDKLIQIISAVNQSTPGFADILFKDDLTISERGKFLSKRAKILQLLKNNSIVAKSLNSVEFVAPNTLRASYVYDMK